MTAARPPCPDTVQIRLNAARGLVQAVLDSAATDTDRQLALAVRHLAQAVEQLAAEVRR